MEIEDVTVCVSGDIWATTIATNSQLLYFSGRTLARSAYTYKATRTCTVIGGAGFKVWENPSSLTFVVNVPPLGTRRITGNILIPGQKT